MSILKLPFIIAGEKIAVDEKDCMEIEYETGLKVLLPRVSAEHIQTIRSSAQHDLQAMSIDDITLFLKRVASLWLDENYYLRKQAVYFGMMISGYSETMLIRDWDYVIRLLYDRNHLYEMLEGELGSRFVMEEWVPVQSCLIRAVPKGKALHIMVGNAPIAALISIIRSILTKNVTIAKLPKRDLITALFLVLSFYEVDPNHPVTRATSVLYWEAGSATEGEFIGMADVICVWGGKEAVEGIRKKASYGTDIIEFGPKRSLHLIDRGIKDINRLAQRVAYDISIYNQEACFRPQAVFIADQAEEFVQCLQYWNDYFLTIFDRGHISKDVCAQVSRTRLEEIFKGAQVISPADNTAWTIIVKKPEVVIEHPLSRSLYVFPVNDLREALPFITKNTQTVGIAPWKSGFQLADALVSRGWKEFAKLAW